MPDGLSRVFDLVEAPFGGERAHGVGEALGEAGVVVARREALGAVRLRVRFVRQAVEEDHVEVAVEGELPAAVLAHAEHGEGGPRHRAVAARKILLHARQQGLDHRVGDIRERAGELIDRHVAPQDLHADLELALVLPAAHAVERVVVVGGGRERSREVV